MVSFVPPFEKLPIEYIVVNSYAGIKPSSPDSSDSGLQELPAVAISIAEFGELGPRANRCSVGSHCSREVRSS